MRMQRDTRSIGYYAGQNRNHLKFKIKILYQITIGLAGFRT